MEQNGGKVFGYISRELYDRHTRTLYRGEEIEFQTRKMSKTTNTLYLTDNQGVPIAISSPYRVIIMIYMGLIVIWMSYCKHQIKLIIATNGLFVNADAGFDSKESRSKCLEYKIIPNTAITPRNGRGDEVIIFDDMLYKQRYTIERTNAWMDSYRTLLNSFKTMESNCKSLIYIAFTTLCLKKIYKNKKSR